jgi:deoxyribodipyrimidine photo-lyase
MDTDLKAALGECGVDVTSVNGRLLFEPWALKTGTGGHYRVFTPFWKAMKKAGGVRGIVPRVSMITGYDGDVLGGTIADLDLLPQSPDWAVEFVDHWTPGETGADDRLNRFIDHAAAGYRDDRNRPDMQGTSGLSPHLQHGEISPVQIWHAIHLAADKGDIPEDQADVFLSEIAWREFSHNLLFHHTDLETKEINQKFAGFPWGRDDAHLDAWQRGQTGYPIVDAGMRQLWQTGWMHNRVRMIVGSFLVKHLMIDWRDGKEWFWDTLVDADIAANTASWQWIAGCGADAAPYFRVFNPILQGERFDPNGDYIRKYVPELSELPDKYLFAPWTAPDRVLATAGVVLGDTYPAPVVDHKLGRERALAAYKSISS